VLAKARAQLVEAGLSESEATVDVDLFARTILGWDRARLIIEQQNPAPDALEPTFSDWISRRATREPSAYIVGRREFWGLDFLVTPAVLIPRPETELIVEAAVSRMRGRAAPRIADVGTGSGCIAVSLATELPDASVVATDVSDAALEVARANAARHHVSERIQFVATSYLDGVSGSFDLIAANPPYVKDGDKPALARGVRHEPDVALFGGAEGLRDIAAVLAASADALIPGGWLVMEFGYGQDSAVEELVGTHRELQFEGVLADLQGIPRTAIIHRR
jgi:release factor glutamine methyltransferase